MFVDGSETIVLNQNKQNHKLSIDKKKNIENAKPYEVPMPIQTFQWYPCLQQSMEFQHTFDQNS